MTNINKLETVNYVSWTIKKLSKMLNEYYGFML